MGVEGQTIEGVEGQVREGLDEGENKYSVGVNV